MKVRLLNTLKRCYFALSEVSVLKLSKIVTKYVFITKYSTKLIMNDAKFIMFLKVIFPGRSKYKKLSFWRLKILARRQHNQFLRQTKIVALRGIAPCIILKLNNNQ